MKNYLSIHDLPSIKDTVKEAIALKKNPLEFQDLGKNKTIGLLFFNNSLRTRLSTQKAALNLGMEPIVMNFGAEGWQLEFEDGTPNGPREVGTHQRSGSGHFSVLRCDCHPRFCGTAGQGKRRSRRGFGKF